MRRAACHTGEMALIALRTSRLASACLARLASGSLTCCPPRPCRTCSPLINLIYEFGDVERNPTLRTLAIHFAQQMEDRLEAYHLCVNKELWEGALQACVDAQDEDRLMELRVAVAKSANPDRAKHLKQIDDVYADSRIRWKSELESQGRPKTVLGTSPLVPLPPIPRPS